jgi:hypothetical protein
MKMFTLIIVATLLCATAANAQSTQRGFSVVLLLGEAQTTSAGDGLPPAPTLRKALSDVKDFLPYKSYRVLDTQWLRGGSTRMHGLDDQEYDVDLLADEVPIVPPFNTKQGMLNVVFHLRRPGPRRIRARNTGGRYRSPTWRSSARIWSRCPSRRAPWRRSKGESSSSINRFVWRRREADRLAV